MQHQLKAASIHEGLPHVIPKPTRVDLPTQERQHNLSLGGGTEAKHSFHPGARAIGSCAVVLALDVGSQEPWSARFFVSHSADLVAVEPQARPLLIDC